MPDLRMTAAREAVLRAVADGRVERRRIWGKHRRDRTLDVIRNDHGAALKTVTPQCNYLAGEGVRLIGLGRQRGPSIYSPQPWGLTPAGERVLADLDAKKEN